ncbi:MAG: glucose-1-phosphate thymidylyltransferase [Hyphomicrobiales bacterium]
MKGLVLAGGKGSRLRPFTYSGAKQLVPIANVPVLHFPVRQLVEAGITDIAIIVGETEPQIREAMGDGSRFGARFTYIRQEAPLGIAHAVLAARPHLGDEPFVLYLGDNVLMGGIAGFAHAFEASDAAAGIILKEVADPRAFGVAEIAGGRLLRMVEKPADPPSNLAVIGVYAFRAPVFEVIERQVPSARGELEIADAINGLLERGLRVDTAITGEYWIDTGKMEDILDANRVILESLAPPVAPPLPGCEASGPLFVEAGAVVDSCVLEGPVAIAAGAVVSNCRIGPHVAIGPRCKLRNVALRNSIVMEQAELADCPGIADSMIGRFTVVCGAPAGTRLTLGDHSRLEARP